DMPTFERRSQISLVVTLAVTLALSFPLLAKAGAPTDSLKQTVDQVVKTLSDPALKEKPHVRPPAVPNTTHTTLPYPNTPPRRPRGEHWNGRTPEQQQEFVKLFADILDRSYVSKIDLYQGERVQYTGETIDGSDATVKTMIAAKNNTDIPVDYRMHVKNGRWVVYDVIIEGVSLVSNYRTQFNKIIQTESYDALVQRLRAKDAAEPAASPSPSPSGGRNRGER